MDPVEVIQRTVDEIEANENVTRIIAMTHIGYAEDIDLAARTRGIHLILGTCLCTLFVIMLIFIMRLHRWALTYTSW